MKKIVIVTIGVMLSVVTFSQQQPVSSRQEKKNIRREKIRQLAKQAEEGALIFQKQSIFGLKLISDGYSLSYELGKLKTPTKTNLYSIEIGERKHPKEQKVPSGRSGFAIANSYVFGKINNFYHVKLGIGQQWLIGGKGNKNGVAVSALYGGGLSAGLLKPYYLDIVTSRGGIRQQVKYTGNDSVFLSPSFITGSSGFTKGLGEMKFVPGAFVKGGLRFDYGRYNELVSAIEVGFNVEGYTQKMPIVLLNKDKRLFFNVYAAIEFGKRK